MAIIFTKSLAQEIFYAGTIFGIVLFLVLSFDTTTALTKPEHRLTSQVKQGKAVWEKNNCIGCHTLLGNGAYYAPELGNVYRRRGSNIDKKKFIKYWLNTVHTKSLKHHRQVPQINLSKEELDALVAFFKWTSEIYTASWPPNIEG